MLVYSLKKKTREKAELDPKASSIYRMQLCKSLAMEAESELHPAQKRRLLGHFLQLFQNKKSPAIFGCQTASSVLRQSFLSFPL